MTTKRELEAALKERMSEIGRSGGKARALAMSPRGRRESARKAARVRWLKDEAAEK